MLSDDKARSEHENRARLDRASDEISDSRKQLEDLKYLLQEKCRENHDLNGEESRLKGTLDEKYHEAGRLREEANVKGAQVHDMREQQNALEREIEAVKVQRAEMWREITRLKELSEAKACEHSQQIEKLRSLDQEIERTNCRIQETQKHIDLKTGDVRSKQVALEETDRELCRVRDAVSKFTAECAAGRRDNERVTAENFDLRKELEFQESRNADISIQIRDTEVRLKEKEEQLFQCRRDVENQRMVQ